MSVMSNLCVSGITWPKCVHAQSQIWAVKTDLWHPCYSFQLYARTALARTKKKCSLRGMGNLKQTELRDWRTEERKAEDRSEKDKSTRITKNYKRKKNGRQKQKTMRNSAWPLSKDWSEVLLERKQRLEKWSLTNTSGWLWRQKKKEEHDWRMMQIPNGSVWSCRRTKKEKQDRRRW